MHYTASVRTALVRVMFGIWKGLTGGVSFPATLHLYPPLILLISSFSLKEGHFMFSLGQM